MILFILFMLGFIGTLCIFGAIAWLVDNHYI